MWEVAETGALALTHAGYLAAGWSLGLAAIGAYAVSVVWRGRTLSRQVPEPRRRWMTAPVEATAAAAPADDSQPETQ